MNKHQLKNFFSKEYRLPLLGRITAIVETFSITEKIFFFGFCAILTISAVTLLGKINRMLTVEIPDKGGSVVEGVIGIPRFINPLIAFSDADRDLTTLVYSGLLRSTGNGDLAPDLAENYEILDDGLSYVFYLRPEATFHDGSPVTADDVIFTIQKAQDPNVKSPKRASWEGVTAEKIDNLTVKIRLKQIYSPFLENATLGILPSRIWKNVDGEQFTFSQYNVEPIGSGPYMITNIKRSSGGIPASYNLKPFKKYPLGEAYIEKLTVKFYGNEDALIEAFKTGEIDSVNTISPKNALDLKDSGVRIESVSLPRIFAVFFNQNQAAIFTHHEIREALNLSLDRDRIIQESLSGYGEKIFGPLPISISSKKNLFSSELHSSNMEKAVEILAKAGWKPDPENGVLEKTVKKTTERLEFTISTSNTPELKSAALIIKESWEKLGAKVNLAFFDTGDLNQGIIRPRKYDALLFGEIVGRDLDLYAFWHSSQRNDPGLNIANYTNIKADKILEQARTTNDIFDRLDKYNSFAEEVAKDIPAIFIYSPYFIYILPEKIKGVEILNIALPSERFLDVKDWFIETDHVWKIFANKQRREMIIN